MSTIIATYQSMDEANRAMDILTNRGISQSEIGIATVDSNNKVEAHGAHGAGEVVKDAIGDTAAGAVSGAGIGGLLGLLAGVAAIAIPGLGGLLITGPLAASLGLSGVAATAVTGATGGAAVGGVAGLAGSLISKGVAESDAQDIEETVKNGGVLIAVDETAADDVEEAMRSTNPARVVELA